MNLVWGIVLAAGGGTRFGEPKQFLDLAGRPLVQWSVDALAPVCDGVVVALPSGAAWRPSGIPVRVVDGGSQRHDSVRAALAAVPVEAEVIVVADAAHPLAGAALVRAVVDAVRAGADGAVPGLPLTEVLADVAPDGARLHGLPRVPDPPASSRVLVQTPQAFDAAAFRAAHATGRAAVEDSALVAATGGRIVVVPGDPANLHVTTPAELDLVRRLALATRGAEACDSAGHRAGEAGD